MYRSGCSPICMKRIFSKKTCSCCCGASSCSISLCWRPNSTPGAWVPPSSPAAGVPLHPTHGAPYIEKTAFSCWDEPRFPPALEALGRPCVLLAGIETHVCILQTAVDLKQAGFLPVVVEDCTSSRRERDRRIAVQRLQTEGILVSTCESILFELTREAGTELFKGISRLVK
jgi:nicotinamidase-related amidase